VLNFAQVNPTICNLKEVKGSLRMAIEPVADIQQAISILKEMAIADQIL
jgi:transcription-repair coupling factor (superfamily II helicase)